METKYFLYFLAGGTVVSVVTYFASQAKGLGVSLYLSFAYFIMNAKKLF